MSFDNAAVAAGFADAPAAYRIAWSRFDNATEDMTRIADTQIVSTRGAPLRDLPTQAGAFIAIDISADSPANPSWAHPARSFFRRTDTGWRLVGLERMPDQPQASAPSPGKR